MVVGGRAPGVRIVKLEGLRSLASEGTGPPATPGLPAGNAPQRPWKTGGGYSIEVGFRFKAKPCPGGVFSAMRNPGQEQGLAPAAGRELRAAAAVAVGDGD